MGSCQHNTCSSLGLKDASSPAFLIWMQSCSVCGRRGPSGLIEKTSEDRGQEDAATPSGRKRLGLRASVRFIYEAGSEAHRLPAVFQCLQRDLIGYVCAILEHLSWTEAKGQPSVLADHVHHNEGKVHLLYHTTGRRQARQVPAHHSIQADVKKG